MRRWFLFPLASLLWALFVIVKSNSVRKLLHNLLENPPKYILSNHSWNLALGDIGPNTPLNLAKRTNHLLIVFGLKSARILSVQDSLYVIFTAYYIINVRVRKLKRPQWWQLKLGESTYVEKQKHVHTLKASVYWSVTIKILCLASNCETNTKFDKMTNIQRQKLSRNTIRMLVCGMVKSWFRIYRYSN